VVVIVISLLPGDSRPVQALTALPFGDKVHHALSYVVLGFLPVLREKVRPAVALLAAAVVLGWIIEIVQAYTGRTPDMIDGMADVLGIAVGAFAGWAVRSRQHA
jgi:VanZ family protein